MIKEKEENLLIKKFEKYKIKISPYIGPNSWQSCKKL